jgi:hypothetical protein
LTDSKFLSDAKELTAFGRRFSPPKDARPSFRADTPKIPGKTASILKISLAILF